MTPDSMPPSPETGPPLLLERLGGVALLRLNRPQATNALSLELQAQLSQRFTELATDLDGIAPNTLTDRLRRLEVARVVQSRPYEERPPRVMYELTAEGQELAGALRLLADWGSRVAPEAKPARHAACGTPVEARWYCPTCERVVDPAEAGDLRFL